MSLGIAIFASVVLVLLVYNAQFRKVFFWIAGIGAGLTGLVVLVLYSHHLYVDRVAVRDAAKHQALVQACTARFADPDKNYYIGANGKRMDWVDVMLECDNNPGLQPHISNESNWVDVPNPHFVEVHGGETLQYVGPTKLPPGAVPIIYLGHKQEFTFVCGDFGERGATPAVNGTAVKCP